MTKDEIVNQLESVNIIVNIAGEYFLTEKYKDIGKAPIVLKPEPLDYNTLINTDEGKSDYPFNIRESRGRNMATHFMDYCKIPAMSNKGYRLRSMPKDAIIILEKIVANKKLEPHKLLAIIANYYVTTEMPKAFKNLLLEGDILDMYTEDSENVINPFNKSNETWG